MFIGWQVLLYMWNFASFLLPYWPGTINPHMRATFQHYIYIYILESPSKTCSDQLANVLRGHLVMHELSTFVLELNVHGL